MPSLHSDPPNASPADVAAPQPRDWLAEIDAVHIGCGMTGMEIVVQFHKLAGVLKDLAREQVARLPADQPSAQPRGQFIGLQRGEPGTHHVTMPSGEQFDVTVTDQAGNPVEREIEMVTRRYGGEPADPAPNMHAKLHRIRMDSGPKERPATFAVGDRAKQPGEYPGGNAVKQPAALAEYRPLKLEKIEPASEPVQPPCDVEAG